MSSPTIEFAVGDPRRAPRVVDLEQPRTAEMPVHPSHRPGYHYALHRLLVQHGSYILEHLRLGELAAARAYRFAFVCAPLTCVGATGSPVRPIAIVAP